MIMRTHKRRFTDVFVNIMFRVHTKMLTGGGGQTVALTIAISA